MDYVVEENGDITFKVGTELEALEAIKDRVGGDDVAFLQEMLDLPGSSLQGNGVFFPIRPEQVGALTDAPMFSDCVDFHDNGDQQVVGDVWWFPNYQVEDFAEKLLREGKVTFTHASY